MSRKTANKARSASHSMPKISDAEWIVMRVVWGNAPITTNQVVQALEDKMHWKPKTIHTLLARLVQKRALAVDRSSREYVFRPLVEAKDCLRAVSRSFLSRFFDGQMAPFLACLLEGEKPSPQEIDDLKRILDENRP